MYRFTLDQRWEILKTYFQCNCCVAETVRKLKRTFGRNNAPTAPGVRKFVKKVRETGMLIDNTNYLRARPKRSNEIIAFVAQSLEENPRLSIRQRANELNISRTTLRRILNKDLGITTDGLYRSNKNVDATAEMDPTSRKDSSDVVPTFIKTETPLVDKVLDDNSAEIIDPKAIVHVNLGSS